MPLWSELCALTRNEKVNVSEGILTVKKTLQKRQRDQILIFLAREVTFELLVKIIFTCLIFHD